MSFLLVQASRPLVRAERTTSLRSFSIAIPARKEGDVVTPKPCGFLADKDPVARRDAENDSFYPRSQETQKLRALRDKMQEQRRYLDFLDKHIQNLAREQGKLRH